jgi:seryl-tRNA synthetase
MDRLVARGFTPVLPPELARAATLEGCGFQPRVSSNDGSKSDDNDLFDSQVYTLEGEGGSALIGTSEIPLCGMYQNCILPSEQLPLKLVGFSHCFRRETGGRSAEARGLYRVHQFSKVEMFVFGPGGEQHDDAASDELYQELCDIQCELYEELGLHCQVLEMPAHDLGAAAFRKQDIETWIPSRGAFGEISSASNCLDYQARRLNIRHKPASAGGDGGGAAQFVHTLNGTAVASPRVIIGLLEQRQRADAAAADGGAEDFIMNIPECLHRYMPDGVTTIPSPAFRARCKPLPVPLHKQ